MLATLWRTVKSRLRAIGVDERGDVVNWLIVTLGIAIAAAAVIAVLRPAIESAGNRSRACSAVAETVVPARMLSRLGDERGSSLVEPLLALGLVALVVAIGVQGFAYLQARSIATAAAQDGARAAVSAGASAGLERSRQVLGAGGGAAARLRASITSSIAASA